MFNFDKLKETLVDGDDEPVEASKADLIPIGSFVTMPEGLTISISDDYFPESAIWREMATS